MTDKVAFPIAAIGSGLFAAVAYGSSGPKWFVAGMIGASIFHGLFALAFAIRHSVRGT